MIYFLIGMPGSGKTTLGKELAKKIQYEYIDLDELIEKREGQAIPSIFEQKGQEYFRQKETEGLEFVIQNYKEILVLTGGGAPCFNNNMDLMNKSGKSIFIDVSSKELFIRLKHGKQNRPLVQGLNDEQLLNKIEQMLLERKPFYRLAHIHLMGDNLSAQDILKTLEKES